MEKYIQKLENEIKPVELIKNYHVYALWSKGKIVYIGQSTQLYSRIKAHTHTKEFDSFSYFECKSQSEMDLVESNLIIKLNPKYNKTITTGYESLAKFRKRIRSIDDEHKYNPKYYVKELEKKLLAGNFDLVKYKDTVCLAVKDVPKAFSYIVGDIYE